MERKKPKITIVKNIIRIIGKLLLAILIIHFVVIIAFWIKNYMYLGTNKERNIAYLSKNKRNIPKRNLDEQRLKHLFEADFYENNVFLLGENHGFADVQEIDKLLFIHLNKKIGLRYYLAEMDSIRANRLNVFLAGSEKNTSLLRQVVLDIKQRIPQQSSQELFRKWSYLYDYNQGLEDSLKMRVIGIDKNFYNETTKISRDSIMFLNFKNIILSRGLENEKFYGLFGFSHVLQSGINSGNYQPFASLVKSSNLSFGHKIKSIVCYTLDSEVYFPENNQYPALPDEKTGLLNVDGPIVLVKGINDLRKVTKENTITLFNLEKENSPYRENQSLAKLKVNYFGNDIFPNKKTQSTTDFFQYVILIRNSAALTKID